ncbi:MAG: hypothetical protein K0S39_5751 [Paenibacillus sp.]|nr:hypothetical protein [Paenibacillus sp.]
MLQRFVFLILIYSLFGGGLPPFTEDVVTRGMDLNCWCVKVATT